MNIPLISYTKIFAFAVHSTSFLPNPFQLQVPCVYPEALLCCYVFGFWDKHGGQSSGVSRGTLFATI